jgi:hypothetical protein
MRLCKAEKVSGNFAKGSAIGRKPCLGSTEKNPSAKDGSMLDCLIVINITFKRINVSIERKIKHKKSAPIGTL